MSSENVTSGLRLSGWYTSARNVVISKRLAVLLAADRAEALALQPDRVGPVAHDRLDGVGAGVGRDVDVVSRAEPVEERVAHDPADEVRAMSRGLEPARERLGRGVGLQEAREPRGNGHVRILSGRARADRLDDERFELAVGTRTRPRSRR